MRASPPVGAVAATKRSSSSRRTIGTQALGTARAGLRVSTSLPPIRTSPTVKRVNKVQQKLDALTDVVRRKEWEDAERLVSDWDTRRVKANVTSVFA